MVKRQLTELDWERVFRVRCKSKSGHQLADEERELITRAHQLDPVRYAAMNDDVFVATAPFGSRQAGG